MPKAGQGRNAEPRRFWRGTVRSPIRAHTTGTTRIAQIIVDRVVRAIGEGEADGQTIVFTDSRDDAANTAAGMELNHFRDMLRQLTVAELESATSPAELLRDAAAGRLPEGKAIDDLESIKRDRPDLWSSYEKVQLLGREDPRLAADVARIDAFEAEHTEVGRRLDWTLLRQRLIGTLSGLGVNPAGPLPSADRVAGGNRHWRQLYDPPSGEWEPLPLQQRGAGLDVSAQMLDQHLGDALLSRGGRDLESIGLGYLAPIRVAVEGIGLASLAGNRSSSP